MIPKPLPSTGRGVLPLVLGILSMVGFGCLTGIPAWIIANAYLKQIAEGVVDAGEQGLAQAGKILGIISTCLMLCAFIIYIPFLIIFTQATGPLGSLGFDEETQGIMKDGPESDSLRQAILSDARAERFKHPEKNYQVLARELTKANGARVAWHKDTLAPPEHCGKYRFSGEKGMLVITDDCGSSALYGWPPKKP